MVYRAAEMYPALKKQIQVKVFMAQKQIQAREEKIKDLRDADDNGKAKIEQLKREIDVLKKRISYIDPTSEIEK